MTRTELDPFSRRQADTVNRRWLAARTEHQRRAQQAWLGVLLTEFTGHELEILDRLGSLTDNDRSLLKAARRAAS